MHGWGEGGGTGLGIAEMKVDVTGEVCRHCSHSQNLASAHCWVRGQDQSRGGLASWLTCRLCFNPPTNVGRTWDESGMPTQPHPRSSAAWGWKCERSLAARAHVVPGTLPVPRCAQSCRAPPMSSDAADDDGRCGCVPGGIWAMLALRRGPPSRGVPVKGKWEGGGGGGTAGEATWGRRAACAALCEAQLRFVDVNYCCWYGTGRV